MEVYGAKFILLDDINTFKNYHNYFELKKDKEYQIIAENKKLRNGYAIFKKINTKAKALVKKVFINLSIKNEEKECLLVQKLVSNGMTVFDVGANVGDYSILLSHLVGYFGTVYSFEPTTHTYKTLKIRIKNCEINNIHPFQKAIFSEDTLINLNEFPDEYSAWNSIGTPVMKDMQGRKLACPPIVQTEIVEGITLDSFCQEKEIRNIDFLKVDVEGSESFALEGASSLLNSKAIRFIQFEISKNMLEGLNKIAKETFDILTKNGYECHKITDSGEIGEQVRDSNSFYENYIAFPSLPINFFTIVLNGQPFIKYHVEVFKQLPFKWHWHIVEGVADLKHDTAWCLQRGGQISDEIHNNGRSNDGTSEYLDELAQQYPDNITVYRKPEGDFWDGKLEMVNAPLANINEECLLWQVDVDELWTVEQLCTARHMFIGNPEKTAAFYWCWYFVGENLVISTRNCYAQNLRQEWLRTWRFKPGYIWEAHEPPILVELLPDNKRSNVATTKPFTHAESEERNLVFQHFAYVTPSQLQFKEKYYGYKGALAQWKSLQEQTKFPVYLSQYFSWVQDATMVDKAESCGIVPIAQKDKNNDSWKFVQIQQPRKTVKLQIPPIVVIDAVFFQLFQTGIARVWRSLLEEWAGNSFCNHVVVLDRAGTAPKIPGIRYRTIPAYNVSDLEGDRQLLQQICDEEGADLFISSYYTTTLSTPSVMMVYDMIPETLGWDIEHPNWRGKHHAIEYASSYLAISENTASDLVKFFPDISSESITVAHCGVKSTFTPASAAEINNFKTKYGISKPYFLLVGANGGYKNAFLFFQAFAQLCSRGGFEIVCAGSQSLLKEDFRTYTSGSPVHILQLSDEELKAAYSGAVALVYPSKLEGFGLPILEAIACGCPVITCPNASIPEVVGEAALYVNDEDVSGMANALCEVQKPDIRNSLIAVGLEQAKQFSWAKMAQTVSSVLIDAPLQALNLREINLIIFPDWSAPEESLGLELQEVVKAIALHSNQSDITLLVDTTDISAEDAKLFLSGVAMNLMMEEDIEVSDDLQISLIGQFSATQWQTLLPRLQARIVLEHENQGAIQQVQAESLTAYQPDSLGNLACSNTLSPA